MNIGNEASSRREAPPHPLTPVCSLSSFKQMKLDHFSSGGATVWGPSTDCSLLLSDHDDSCGPRLFGGGR